MRGIVNLLIVILIVYTLNAVPINNTMLSFDLIKPWENLQTETADAEIPVETALPVIKLLSRTEEQLNNPKLITLEFSSSRELTDDELDYLKDNTSVTLSDYRNKGIMGFSTIEVVDRSWLGQFNETNNQWIYEITLDLSTENMDLFLGAYNITLSFVDDEWQMDEQVSIDFAYTPEFAYNSAIPSVDVNQVYTQVYYLNASKEFLVPITKKLDSSSKFIRNTISTLSYEIPEDAQIFAQNVNIPRLPRVYLNNGVLSCYLNASDLTDFETGSKENKLITLALVKTLTDIGYVDNLTFFVNNNQSGTFINNLPLKTIYNEDFSTYAYLNYYDGKGQSFLVPQQVNDGQDTVEDLIDILRTTYTPVENGGLIASTLPSTVELISKKQSGSQVTLTFSDTLLSAYGDSPEIQTMMADSLVQSITSLPSVTEVIITTESHTSGQLGNINLGTPVTSNRFLNPIR